MSKRPERVRSDYKHHWEEMPQERWGGRHHEGSRYPVSSLKRQGRESGIESPAKRVQFSILDARSVDQNYQRTTGRDPDCRSSDPDLSEASLGAERGSVGDNRYDDRLSPKDRSLCPAVSLANGDTVGTGRNGRVRDSSPGSRSTVPTSTRWWTVDRIDSWDDPTGPGFDDEVKGASDQAVLADEQEAFHHDWMSQIEPARNDSALQKARDRNLARLRQAERADGEILGKYLPSELSFWFPFSVQGPVDVFEPSAEWLEEVLDIARTQCPIPKTPTVQFSCDAKSIEHNTETLRKCDWDLEKFFELHRGTTIDHGSEFRPTDQLQRVVGRHPNFPFLQKMLDTGFEYFLSRELTESERLQEFDLQFERGNHKSASHENEAVAQGLLESDVKHGFALPIQAGRLRLVKGVHLQPGGMVEQFGLNADGSRKRKRRFTHDLSFSISRNDASINGRVNMSHYPEMIYGWCFNRIMHYLAALRHHHPGQKIYISKFDFSDAYKRMSQSPRTCAATVVRFAEIAYIFLRMAFGGSPNPAAFSGFSETLTDVANELAMSRYHPSQGTSPTVKEIHATIREVEDDNTEVAPAVLPALEVPIAGRTSNRDCFIDDIIDCHMGTDENLARAPHLVQMAVHVMSRPHAGDEMEPVPRKPLLGPEKLEAEGRSAEVQIVLGWEIRTRTFEVRLPHDKYAAWASDVQTVRLGQRVLVQDLESLVGRLNHAASIIPLSRHFLNEIRNRCVRGPRRGNAQIRLSTEEKSDLELWESFLKIAYTGISINLLVIRNPTRMAWSDSCPFGLGGYTLSGTAWRIRVPREAPYYGDDAVNNVLEFLGMAISVLLLLKEAREAGEKFPCLLVLGDNTSAISWLFRSGRVSKSVRYYPTIKRIARHVARCVTEGQAQLCSQHIAGAENQVADALSFEGSCRHKLNPLTKDCPPNDILTQRLHLYHSQLIPNGFKICQLPEEIESFALSVMRITAKSWTPRERLPTKNVRDTGADGKDSSKTGDLGMTLTSIRYPNTTRDCCWREDLSCTIEPSSSTDRERLLTDVRSQWYKRLFETPLAAWLRRSGNVTGRAPSTSRTESLVRNRCIPK